MDPSNIRAIFFDIGSTLRVTDKNQDFLAEGRRKLAALAGSEEDPQVFYDRLKARYDVYRAQSKIDCLDYPEIEFWQQIMLPDVDGEYTARHARELTCLWRDGTNGRRMTRHDTVETVKELHRRGYVLGVIANTITENEITDWMIDEGISRCFRTTILSCKVRLRKPDPGIYHLACRCCGVPEERCVYIGDNVERDVEGTYAAGFGGAILIDSGKKPEKTEQLRRACDCLIRDLGDLLDLFPPLN